LLGQLRETARHAAGASAEGMSVFSRAAQDDATRRGLRDMASAKALAGLMEAVYERPGGKAPVEDRIAALQQLAGSASRVAESMVKAIGHEPSNAAPHIWAHALESVTGLVARAWARHDQEVDWVQLIERAAAQPDIVHVAQAMAHAVYMPVDASSDGRTIAQERLALSLHNAYWEVYLLGQKCDGIDADVAAGVVRSIGEYVIERKKYADLDISVSWMQGSIRRITALFCAQMRALPDPLTADDIAQAISLAKEGFEGVESHASQLLELCRGGVPQPGDAPGARPGPR